MGPRFFNRGKDWMNSTPVAHASCFNGASVFQPRKARKSRVSPGCRPELQWGLGFSTEESRFSQLFPPAVARFNGASVFQPRKEAGGVELPPIITWLQWGLGFSTEESPLQADTGDRRRNSFNGASVFQPRKEAKRRELLNLLRVLQWGLGFSTEERGGG